LAENGVGTSLRISFAKFGGSEAAFYENGSPGSLLSALLRRKF
jgi:hypothetical protein